MENHQRNKKPIVEKNNDQEDYISTLPNSILSYILSHLWATEAGKTSVLSKRWRHVWTTPHNLILDSQNILNTQQFPSLATNIICHHLNQQILFSHKFDRTKAFVSKVNNYLSRLSKFQPHKIEKLRIYFPFCRGSYGSDDLAKWMNFAIGRNVEEIDLCFWEDNEQSGPNYGALYIFPCDVINSTKSLKCLRLAHCVISPQKAYNSSGLFSTLTTLDLMKVDLVSGQNIQIMLASCHSLQWLSFTECYNMNYLMIEQPFCQNLMYLNVSLCSRLRAIVVKSSVLETFEYTGCIIEFRFDAPRLRNFYSHMNDSRIFFSLAIALPQLETLFMECSCTMSETQVKAIDLTRMPTFPNLRHLMVMKVATFRHDSWWLAVVLKVCPTLRRLEVHLRTIFHFDVELGKTYPPRLQHDHLNEVAMTGIKGHSSEIEMAIYLAQNASALQKMTIDPRPRIYLGNGKWGLSDACYDSWSMVEKQKFHEQLKQFFCSQVELLIL